MEYQNNKNSLSTVIEENQNRDSASLLNDQPIDKDNLCIKMEKILQKQKCNKKRFKSSNRTIQRASQGYKDHNLVDSARVLQQFQATRQKQRHGKKCFLLCC